MQATRQQIRDWASSFAHRSAADAIASRCVDISINIRHSNGMLTFDDHIDRVRDRAYRRAMKVIHANARVI